MEFARVNIRVLKLQKYDLMKHLNVKMKKKKINN